MTRPIKQYCEYFSHDKDMRNHRKIKAVRVKFGISGYAIWCMILEYLTGCDGNRFNDSDEEIELISGDFGVSAPEIRHVLDYCSSLRLLFKKDGFVYSESLNERLKPVYLKREHNKSKSEQQHRVSGKFANNNTASAVVSAPDKPQRKGKESKVKNMLLHYDNIQDFEKAAAAEFIKENLPPVFDVQKESHKLAKKYLGQEVHLQNLIMSWVENYIPSKASTSGQPILINNTEHKACKNGVEYIYPTIRGKKFNEEKTEVQLIDNTWQKLSQTQSNWAKAEKLKPEEIWKGKTK